MSKSSQSKDAGTFVERANEFVEVRQSRIHGTGCFAACDIPAGARVIEYVGDLIPKDEAQRLCDEENVYVFSLNDSHDINGNVDWNPARFMNHSCAPNCEAENDDEHIWILSLRDIRTGEELTYNYGYDLGEFHDNPCACNTEDCVGFIVAEEHKDHARVHRQRQLSGGKPRELVNQMA